MRSVTTLIGLSLPLALGLGGCALPAGLMIANYASDGVLLVATGKTKSDHLMSIMNKQDCSTFRVIEGKEICHDWADGKGPYGGVDDNPTDLVAVNEVGLPINDATRQNWVATNNFSPPLGQNMARADGGNATAPAKPVARDAKTVDIALPAAAKPADRADLAKVQSAPLAPLPGAGPTDQPDNASKGDQVAQAAPVKVTNAPADLPKIAPQKQNGPPRMAGGGTNAARNYQVQIGSYRQQANAQAVARKYQALQATAEPVRQGDVVLWRVSTGGLDAARAKQLRKSFHDAGFRDAIITRQSDRRGPVDGSLTAQLAR